MGLFGTTSTFGTTPAQTAAAIQTQQAQQNQPQQPPPQVADTFSKEPINNQGQYLGTLEGKYVFTDSQGQVTGEAETFFAGLAPQQAPYGSGITNPDTRPYYGAIARGVTADTQGPAGVAFKGVLGDISRQQAANVGISARNAAYNAALAGDMSALSDVGVSQERFAQIRATAPQYTEAGNYIPGTGAPSGPQPAIFDVTNAGAMKATPLTPSGTSLLQTPQTPASLAAAQARGDINIQRSDIFASPDSVVYKAYNAALSAQGQPVSQPAPLILQTASIPFIAGPNKPGAATETRGQAYLTPEGQTAAIANARALDTYTLQTTLGTQDVSMAQKNLGAQSNEARARRGIALIKEGKTEEGIDLLRKSTTEEPELYQTITTTKPKVVSYPAYRETTPQEYTKIELPNLTSGVPSVSLNLQPSEVYDVMGNNVVGVIGVPDVSAIGGATEVSLGEGGALAVSYSGLTMNPNIYGPAYDLSKDVVVPERIRLRAIAEQEKETTNAWNTSLLAAGFPSGPMVITRVQQEANNARLEAAGFAPLPIQETAPSVQSEEVTPQVKYGSFGAFYSTTPNITASQYIDITTGQEAQRVSKDILSNPAFDYIGAVPVIGGFWEGNVKSIIGAGITTGYGVSAFGAKLSNTERQFIDVASMNAPLTGELSIYERSGQAQESVSGTTKEVAQLLLLGAAGAVVSSASVGLPLVGKIAGKDALRYGFAGYTGLQTKEAGRMIYTSSGEQIEAPYGGLAAGLVGAGLILALPTEKAAVRYGEPQTALESIMKIYESGKVEAKPSIIGPKLYGQKGSPSPSIIGVSLTEEGVVISKTGVGFFERGQYQPSKFQVYPAVEEGFFARAKYLGEAKTTVEAFVGGKRVPSKDITQRTGFVGNLEAKVNVKAPVSEFDVPKMRVQSKIVSSEVSRKGLYAFEDLGKPIEARVSAPSAPALKVQLPPNEALPSTLAEVSNLRVAQPMKTQYSFSQDARGAPQPDPLYFLKNTKRPTGTTSVPQTGSDFAYLYERTAYDIYSQYRGSPAEGYPVIGLQRYNPPTEGTLIFNYGRVARSSTYAEVSPPIKEIGADVRLKGWVEVKTPKTSYDTPPSERGATRVYSERPSKMPNYAEPSTAEMRGKAVADLEWEASLRTEQGKPMSYSERSKWLDNRIEELRIKAATEKLSKKATIEIQVGSADVSPIKSGGLKIFKELPVESTNLNEALAGAGKIDVLPHIKITEIAKGKRLYELELPDKTVVSKVVVSDLGKKGEIGISQLETRPSQRGRGFGTKVMEAVFEKEQPTMLKSDSGWNQLGKRTAASGARNTGYTKGITDITYTNVETPTGIKKVPNYNERLYGTERNPVFKQGARPLKEKILPDMSVDVMQPEVLPSGTQGNVKPSSYYRINAQTLTDGKVLETRGKIHDVFEPVGGKGLYTYTEPNVRGVISYRGAPKSAASSTPMDYNVVFPKEPVRPLKMKGPAESMMGVPEAKPLTPDMTSPSAIAKQVKEVQKTNPNAFNYEPPKPDTGFKLSYERQAMEELPASLRTAFEQYVPQKTGAIAVQKVASAEAQAATASLNVVVQARTTQIAAQQAASIQAQIAAMPKYAEPSFIYLGTAAVGASSAAQMPMLSLQEAYAAPKQAQYTAGETGFKQAAMPYEMTISAPRSIAVPKELTSTRALTGTRESLSTRNLLGTRELNSVRELTFPREAVATREALATREAIATREAVATREALATREAIATREATATRELTTPRVVVVPRVPDIPRPRPLRIPIIVRPPPTPTTYGRIPKMAAKSFKLPKFEPIRGQRLPPLADIISQTQSQLKYGKATSPSFIKRPQAIKYTRNLAGFVPTVEQITGAKLKKWSWRL